MEDIRGVRLRKFELRKIVLGVRMHFRHTPRVQNSIYQNYSIIIIIRLLFQMPLKHSTYQFSLTQTPF